MGFIKHVCKLNTGSIITPEEEKIIFNMLDEYRGSSEYERYVWEIAYAYQGIINNCINSIHLGNYAREDAWEDALQFLFETVKKYDINNEKKASFVTFAMIPYNIIYPLRDLVNKHNGKPKESLNDSYDDENEKIDNIVDEGGHSPLEYAQKNEINKAIIYAISLLTDFEKKIWVMHIEMKMSLQKMGDTLYPYELPATKKTKAARDWDSVRLKIAKILVERGINYYEL